MKNRARLGPTPFTKEQCVGSGLLSRLHPPLTTSSPTRDPKDSKATPVFLYPIHPCPYQPAPGCPSRHPPVVSSPVFPPAPPAVHP
ncbi:hypothetical protein SUGI_0206950 [Cryptomeria japonica]|nr:hypothetical protein SUGI_0206950 [Cryptomeria japonica]